jgi:predicted GNAT superfamily acetyltransferase
MPPTPSVQVFDAASRHWNADVDRLRALLGAPANPALFPPHFLKATFPKLGGRMVVFQSRRGPLAVGFLFPRALRSDSRVFTLRLHRVDRATPLDPALLAHQAAEALGSVEVVPFDPEASHEFQPTSVLEDGLDLGAPSRAETEQVRSLQREIWGSEADFLYPSDLHSIDFRPGTSLVARVDAEPVAFLFGFYTFGGPALPPAWSDQFGSALTVESQLLGVHPSHRGRNLGFRLKRQQAHQAATEGIRVITWTVDPLQFANAVLNFAWLKGVCWSFFPDHYSFRNALSRVAASRLGVVWPIQSARVQASLAAGPGPIPNLADSPEVPRVGFGELDSPALDQAPRVAIQIPANWTTLQQHEPEAALNLRQSTDALFQRWLGPEPGKLVLSGVAEDGPRKYLLAERVTPDLLEALGG